jgi:hypothetical protein
MDTVSIHHLPMHFRFLGPLRGFRNELTVWAIGGPRDHNRGPASRTTHNNRVSR